MTMQELVAKHGRVTPKDLPKRSGPKFGTRVFDDEGEEKILLFVLEEQNPPELAAVHCGTSKTTIDNVISRVRARLKIVKAPLSSRTGAGLSTSTTPEGTVGSSLTDVPQDLPVSA